MYQGILIWLPEAERPSPRLFEQMVANQAPHTQQGTLQALACGLRPVAGMLPWIKMSTGQGSAVYGYAEIRGIQQAFCGGATI